MKTVPKLVLYMHSMYSVNHILNMGRNKRIPDQLSIPPRLTDSTQAAQIAISL